MQNKRIHEHSKMHLDRDYPYAYAQRWLLEAQQIIAMDCETGSIKDSVEIKADKNNAWYDLPKDFIRMIRVYKDNNVTEDYRNEEGKILLPKAGTYLIEYKRIPKTSTKETDEPEIHELYHYPMSYFLASKEAYRFNPEDQDGPRLEATFLSEIQRVNAVLMKKTRRRFIKV